MDRDYFERGYAQIMREFRTAIDEDEQWRCRRRAAELERTCMIVLGTEVADELHEKYNN